MVIVGLSPGLANQMYEYATAYALAQELNQELILDISECICSPWGYLLDFFNIPDEKKLVYFIHDSEHMGHTDIERIPEFLRKKTIIFTEDDQIGAIKYDSLYDTHKDYDADIYLCGYFFNREKYYDKYWKEIREGFLLKTKIKEVEMFRDLIKDKISVGIHIRRGDMLLADWAEKMEDNYYRAAIEYCRKHFGECIFLIFSDDITYAKKILGKDNSLWYVHFVGYQDADIAEFVCLSLCSHRILSNSSTFSRLADELSTNRKGRTFYQSEASLQINLVRHIVRMIKRKLYLLKGSKQIIRLDKYDVEKYSKNYRQDKKDNIENYKERIKAILEENVTKNNCKIILNEIATLSLNTYDLSVNETNKLLYQKFNALVSAEEYHMALTVSKPIYEMYAEDTIYRNNLIKSLIAVGANKEAEMESKRSKDKKQFIIIPAGKSYASGKSCGLVELGIILHHLGHEVSFIFEPMDKTEEFYINRNEFLINKREINLGCKQYQRKNIKEDFEAFLDKFQENELFIITRSKEFCGKRFKRKQIKYIFPDFSDDRDAESQVGNRMPKDETEYLYNNADIIMTQNENIYHNFSECILWEDNAHKEEYWLEEKRWQFGDLDRFSERAICMAEALHDYL